MILSKITLSKQTPSIMTPRRMTPSRMIPSRMTPRRMTSTQQKCHILFTLKLSGKVLSCSVECHSAKCHGTYNMCRSCHVVSKRLLTLLFQQELSFQTFYRKSNKQFDQKYVLFHFYFTIFFKDFANFQERDSQK